MYAVFKYNYKMHSIFKYNYKINSIFKYNKCIYYLLFKYDKYLAPNTGSSFAPNVGTNRREK